MKRVLVAAVAVMLVGGLHAEEKVDLSMTGRIRQEAFTHSQVMPLLTHLTEQIGPAPDQLPRDGAGECLDAFEVQRMGPGRRPRRSHARCVRSRLGIPSASVEMLSPRAFPLHALPKPGRPAPTAGRGRRVRRQARIEGGP
jgi:hypothetical protein